MIFLKKYFQNRKGLQKLSTKHVPHAPKRRKKNLKLFMTYEGGSFKKGGLRGSKNENFEKIPTKPKRASKIGY